MSMSSEPARGGPASWHATTILTVRKGGKVVIAGDGPLREELQAFSNFQQLTQIQWLGAIDQPQLVRLMQQHQMVVVPSLVEPFGTVVPEALACGCTVICSNSGRCNDRSK